VNQSTAFLDFPGGEDLRPPGDEFVYATKFMCLLAGFLETLVRPHSEIQEGEPAQTAGS
jgi:hypothetical protein